MPSGSGLFQVATYSVSNVDQNVNNILRQLIWRHIYDRLQQAAQQVRMRRSLGGVCLVIFLLGEDWAATGWCHPKGDARSRNGWRFHDAIPTSCWTATMRPSLSRIAVAPVSGANTFRLQGCWRRTASRTRLLTIQASS